MSIDFSEINHLIDPSFDSIQADFEQFLLSLTGPTVIDITGKDRSKTSVITTLLQGDEPSGFIAIHRWLSERDSTTKPETNLRFIICSVEAAVIRPLFSNKVVSNGLNINRCFNACAPISFQTSNHLCCYMRAFLIEKAIRDVNPICIIDLHNSGSPSPAYAICKVITDETLTLTSLFCQSLVVSDLKIGALMELSYECPFITVECGYKNDIQSHERAYRGLVKLANKDRTNEKCNVEIKYKPLRLCIKEGVSLSFSDKDEGHKGVTLKSDIDYFNFGQIYQDEMIGWIDTKGLDNLILMNTHGQDVINDYFYIRDNQIACKSTYQLLKATANIVDATTDCLFYITK